MPRLKPHAQFVADCVAVLTGLMDLERRGIDRISLSTLYQVLGQDTVRLKLTCGRLLRWEAIDCPDPEHFHLTAKGRAFAAELDQIMEAARGRS